jgi:hypothetical protein
MSLVADPLVHVAVRVYADFADRATLAEVLAVVGRARSDLDTRVPRRCRSWSSGWPGSGSPMASPTLRPASARLRANTAPNPTGETGSSAPGAPGVRKPVTAGTRLDDLPGEGEPVNDGGASRGSVNVLIQQRLLSLRQRRAVRRPTGEGQTHREQRHLGLDPTEHHPQVMKVHLPSPDFGSW